MGVLTRKTKFKFNTGIFLYNNTGNIYKFNFKKCYWKYSRARVCMGEKGGINSCNTVGWCTDDIARSIKSAKQSEAERSDAAARRNVKSRGSVICPRRMAVVCGAWRQHRPRDQSGNKWIFFRQRARDGGGLSGDEMYSRSPDGRSGRR